MLLSEIFDQLTYGELSQTVLGGDDSLGIQECDYPKIIPHINLGLTDLHTRFDLKRDSVIIECDETIQRYYIDKRYAESNTASSEPIKYIKDTVDNPYLDTLLKIEQISDSEGMALSINNPRDENTLRSTSNNSFIVESPVQGELLTVEFRCKHDKIPIAGSLASVEVHLPYGLLNCLLLFIGARVMANMNGDQLGESNVLFQRYEMACMQVSNEGIVLIDETSNEKLDARGFA